MRRKPANFPPLRETAVFEILRARSHHPIPTMAPKANAKAAMNRTAPWPTVRRGRGTTSMSNGASGKFIGSSFRPVGFSSVFGPHFGFRNAQMKFGLVRTYYDVRARPDPMAVSASLGSPRTRESTLPGKITRTGNCRFLESAPSLPDSNSIAIPHPITDHVRRIS